MKRNRIALVGLAPVGLSIAINDQRFDLVAHEPHARRDGTTTTLMVWQAECLNCGDGFVSRTPAGRMAEVRRCKPCRSSRKAGS